MAKDVSDKCTINSVSHNDSATDTRGTKGHKSSFRKLKLKELHARVEHETQSPAD